MLYVRRGLDLDVRINSYSSEVDQEVIEAVDWLAMQRETGWPNCMPAE